MTGTEIIPKATIVELVLHRDRAMDLFRTGAEMIQEALKTAQLAAPSQTTVGPCRNDFQDLGFRCERSVEGFVAAARKSIDRALWRHAMEATHLAKVMDAKARQDFSAQLEKDPPEATLDNLMATLWEKVGDSQNIFKRGVVETFRILDPNRYKRNGAYKIERRVAFPNAFSAGGRGVLSYRYWNHYARIDEHLRDIERVFYVLDDYFKCRWYFCGSLHITFLKPELVMRCNQIIAEYYGPALADGARP
jgi:hypothetical protein